MRVLAPWTGILAAGALLAGCDGPAPAPEPATPPAVTAQAEPVPRVGPPDPTPNAVDGASAPPLSLPALSWPRGFAVRRSGTLGGAVTPAAWFELEVENTGAVDAARRALQVLAEAAGAGAFADLAPAADGRSAVGQVRGPKLSAVVAAAAEGNGASVRITLEPLRAEG